MIPLGVGRVLFFVALWIMGALLAVGLLVAGKGSPMAPDQAPAPARGAGAPAPAAAGGPVGLLPAGVPVAPFMVGAVAGAVWVVKRVRRGRRGRASVRQYQAAEVWAIYDVARTVGHWPHDAPPNVWVRVAGWRPARVGRRRFEPIHAADFWLGWSPDRFEPDTLTLLRTMLEQRLPHLGPLEVTAAPEFPAVHVTVGRPVLPEVAWYPEDYDSASYWRYEPWAVDERGGLVSRDVLTTPGVLDGAEAGGGKTTRQRVRVLHHVRSGMAEVYICDLAGTLAAGFRDQPRVHLAESMPAIEATIAGVLTMMTGERLTTFRELLAAGLDDDQATVALCQRHRLIKLAIDELAAVMAQASPKAKKGLARLAAEGRKFGIDVDAASQYVNKTTVAPWVKVNLTGRAAGPCKGTAASMLIIDAPYATKLPRSIPGRCLLDPGGGLVLAQAFYFRREDLARLLSRPLEPAPGLELAAVAPARQNAGVGQTDLDSEGVDEDAAVI